MSDKKFSPGPWRYYSYPQPNGCPIIGSGGLMVAMLAHSVNHQDQEETAIANANLITAAPDLYVALEKAVADYGKPRGPWNVPSEPGTWLEMAKNALKKARGEECAKEL